jgi:hypothetical protein
MVIAEYNGNTPWEPKPTLAERFFGAVNPITALRQKGKIDRVEIDEDTKTELLRKDAERTLAMADRIAQADIRIQDRECECHEENRMLYVEALAYLQRKREMEELISIETGLHPILVERFVNSHKVISVSCSSETGAVARTHRYGASPRTCNGLTKRSTRGRRRGGNKTHLRQKREKKIMARYFYCSNRELHGGRKYWLKVPYFWGGRPMCKWCYDFCCKRLRRVR